MNLSLPRASLVLSSFALITVGLSGCAADDADLEDDTTEEEVGQSADEIRTCPSPMTVSCRAGSSSCNRSFAESRCAAYGSVRSVTRTSSGYRCTYYCPVNGR